MSKINVNNLSFGDCCDGGCKGMRRPKLLEVLTSVMGGLRWFNALIGPIIVLPSRKQKQDPPGDAGWVGCGRGYCIVL